MLRRTRPRGPLLIALAGATLLTVVPARGDIAPNAVALGLIPPQPLGHTPEVVRQFSGSPTPAPFEDAPVEVALSDYRTVVDLYPTFLVVRLEFALRSAAAAGGPAAVDVVLPERTMGAFYSAPLPIAEDAQPLWRIRAVHGFPIEDLALHEGGARRPIGDWVPDARGWSWRVALARGATRRTALSYVAGLYQAIESRGQPLRAVIAVLPRGASLWHGPVDQLTLTVRPHGIDTAKIQTGVAPHARTAEELRWRFADGEPGDDFHLGFELAPAEVARAGFGAAPYPLAGVPPRLVLLDRLVRMVRYLQLMQREDAPRLDDEQLADRGEELLAVLRAALESDDADASDFAAAALDRLAPACSPGLIQDPPQPFARPPKIDRPGSARYAPALRRLELDDPYLVAPRDLVHLACERAFDRWRRIRIGLGAAIAAALVTLGAVLIRRRRARSASRRP